MCRTVDYCDQFSEIVSDFAVLWLCKNFISIWCFSWWCERIESVIFLLLKFCSLFCFFFFGLEYPRGKNGILCVTVFFCLRCAYDLWLELLVWLVLLLAHRECCILFSSYWVSFNLALFDGWSYFIFLLSSLITELNFLLYGDQFISTSSSCLIWEFQLNTASLQLDGVYLLGYDFVL